VHGVLRHRIALSYEANADGISTNDVIDEILRLVAVA
jgi:MoxR-like ATPase